MSLVQFRPEAPNQEQTQCRITCVAFAIEKSDADLAHLVERNLAKVEVAGSTPVIRSKGLPWGFSPIAPCQKFGKWRHSQAVRQRSATPLSPVRFWVAPPKFTPKKQDADVAQVVAHILGKDEVAGPNPAISSSLVR